MDTTGEWLEVAADSDSGTGERHRAVGSAVEAAAERDDQRPSSGDLGQLDRRLDRLGTRVGEEERYRIIGHRGPREIPRETCVQLEPGLVVHDVLLRMDDPRRLIGDRGGHPRMRMPGARDRDPG